MAEFIELHPQVLSNNNEQAQEITQTLKDTNSSRTKTESDGTGAGFSHLESNDVPYVD